MKQKNNKVVQFPTHTEDSEKNIVHKIKINWIIFFSALGVIVTAMGIVSNHILNKKSEIQFKPVIDLSIEYNEDEYYGDIHLNQDSSNYISGISIEARDNNAESINITVEPFYNIIYYNQSQQTLIKQILPIYNIENISEKYTPLEVKKINLKNDTIANIGLNENTYEIIFDMMCLFTDSQEINYNDSFLELFSDSIIASIDFEYYITIDYSDIYNNNYTDVYLCETGYTNFSGYLTDIMYMDYSGELDENLKYNMECLVAYCALKAHNLDNMEFDAKVSQISSNNIVYKEFHKLYSVIYQTSDSIIYTPKWDRNLYTLVSDGYEQKQLIFVLNKDNSMWESLVK